MHDAVICTEGEGVNGPAGKLANLLGAVGLLVQDALADANASDSASAALICVGSHPDESIGALSQALGISHSGTVRLVEKLVEENLVRRTRTAEDKRSAVLRLTSKGKKRFTPLLKRRQEALAALTDWVSDADTKRLTALFSRMLAESVSSKEDARRACRLCCEDACRPSGCPVEEAAQADS